MGLYHTVEQGECFVSIARKYGFRDHRTLYDAVENAELKQARPNPNVLNPGDKVFVPDPREKSVTVATGKAHHFLLRRHRVLLRMLLGSDSQHPYADRAYQLTVGDQTIRGRTDARGLLDEDIPPDATEATLRLFLDESEGAASLDWQIALGALDSADTVSGVQARLNNLGFYCGDVNGELGPRTKSALAAFQLSVNLPDTGEIDATTSARLVAEHDQLS